MMSDVIKSNCPLHFRCHSWTQKIYSDLKKMKGANPHILERGTIDCLMNDFNDYYQG